MRNLIFISFLFLLFSCKGDSQKKETKQNTKQDSEWFSIELAETLADATTDQKPYSSFVKDIEYIPLETTSKSLIGAGGRGVSIHTVTKKVIVVDMKIFSRKDGRYIGDLLSRGQGPEEYLDVSCVIANDEREEFYLFDTHKKLLHTVGYDNSYKKNEVWVRDWFLKYFLLKNGNLLISRSQYLNAPFGLDGPDGIEGLNSLDDFQIININTKKVLSRRRSSALTNIEDLEDCKHIIKYPKRNYHIALGENLYWKYKDNIRYYDYLTDSIFSIDKNMIVNPIGTLGFEKLKLNGDQWCTPHSRRSVPSWTIKNISETSDEILISFFSLSGGNKMMRALYLLIYSKANKTTKIIMQGDKAQPMNRLPMYVLRPSPYLNDLDNRIAFSPTNVTQNESAYYDFISAESIKELMEEKGASAYTTEKEKAFKAMADTLKFDDNEVIGILHVDW